jgi:L,D-transpeptidase YcbB
MRSTRLRLLRLAAVSCALLVGAPAAAQERVDPEVVDQLKWRVEQLRMAGSVQVGEAVVPSRELTLEAYERRGFLPLWSERGALDGLLEAVASAREDGLEPEHYHLSALAVSRSAWSAGGLAERDLLATDAFVRLSHDLRFGKAEPQGPASDLDVDWPFGGPERVERLEDVASSGRVRAALAELRPRHFVYRGLTAALADLRRIESAGGWEPVPAGPALASDSIGARVLLLRQRLRVTGDLPGESEVSSALFDAELEEAVRAFQHRHGLNEDGVVGNGTLAALNVPVERRIDQVRVNLERARWVSHELPDTFVAVNVAGARVHLLHGDAVAFESRAIVGTRFTQTPSFTAPMLYIDLNPTWTVPPGIVGEVLAEVRRDPEYLSRLGMRVLDTSGGEVDPEAIDFSRYTARSFPYVFRQDPGPANALGRIKLMLPNEHRVYLHDTPTRGLFAREERLFSHGCVRVQDPVGLAELVLGDPMRWSRASLESAIDSGAMQTIRLPRPIPVFVLYWTAAVDPDGVVHFHRDVYGRDASVLAALDAGPAEGTQASRPR